nr:MAG TPA: Terminase small subunit [Caudoviricetes sp.]
MATRMTAKQKRFCDEYLIDLNATQAAIRAGYSKKAARQVGNENMSKPYIKNYIEERMQEKEDSLIAKQDEVLKYLTSVMRGESKSSVLAMAGDGVQEVIQKPPDERERTKAAELLGKRYRLFTDKVEVEGAVPIVIVDDIDE